MGTDKFPICNSKNASHQSHNRPVPDPGEGRGGEGRGGEGRGGGGDAPPPPLFLAK